MPPMEDLQQRGYAVTVKRVELRRGNWKGVLCILENGFSPEAILEDLPVPEEKAQDAASGAGQLLVDPHITVLG